MSACKEYLLSSGQRAPLVMEQTTARPLAEFILAQSSRIQERLATHGALLFRGFGLQDVGDFDAAMEALSAHRMDYVYGSTPRTALGSRIFTATEYPETLEIPLHNENSYQQTWPLKIALCCLVPATTDGETPIADMREVAAAIGPALMDKFERKRVQYVRHYHPFIDVPWQKVFQTEDRGVLARFCAEHDIQHEWVDTETLRTSQVCQGVARHPVSGERVFFNQAHLFHVSSLGPQAAKAFTELYASQLPRQTFYGDASEIPAEDLERVRDAFNRAKVIFPWAAGDVLLLDNMQVAHGRRTYKGPRKVIAALMEPHSEKGATRLS
jgi:alpha-ketoglutarate-dependent taurine dioxygenase